MVKTGKPLGSMIIDLGLNDTAFKKGLQGSKQQTKFWMSEMKSNMRVMDLAGDKAGKLKARQEGLTKVIETQKKEVEQLTKRYKESYDEQGNATAKTADYAREVNNSVGKLAGFEKQLKDVSRELANSSSKMIGFGNDVTAFGGKMQKFGGKITGVGKSLTKNITKPALAAVSALAGIALVKGFQRLKGIDEAKAKLMGLGHSGKEIDAIMTSALDSVKGTSFGMDEAATTAAGAVAAGVKEGKELTKYLSITGDAAAIAGTSLAEMGPIFNKVQTSNKAYTDNLNQLADRGLPIYQWLAEEAGVTAEEVSKMASSGEISSEMFLNAVEKNIGGAAKKMGDYSFTAKVSNIGASIGRIGANFLDAGGKGGGFFSTIKPLLNDLLEKLGDFEDTAAVLGEKFGKAFIQAIEKVKELKKQFDGLEQWKKDLMKKFAISMLIVGPIMQVLGGVVGKLGFVFGKIGTGITIFGKLGTAIKIAGGFLPWLSGLLAAVNWPLILIGGAIVAVGVAFYQAYTKIEPFKLFIDELIASFVTFSTELYANYIKPAIDEIVRAFTEFITNLRKFWKENGEQILNGVKNFLGFVWAMIQPALGFWIGIFKATFKTIVDLIKIAWDTITGVFSGVFKVIGGLIKVFTGIFTGDWELMWEGIKDMASGAWEIVTSGFEGFAKAIGRIAGGIGDAIASGIGGAVNGVIDAINWVLDKLGAAKLDHVTWGSKKKPNKAGKMNSKGQYATYAKGTDGHPGGPAMVNDQKGSKFKELLQYPNGKTFIPEGRNVLIPNMPKGTKVLPATLTSQLVPHYAGGIGNWFGDKWNKFKDFTGDVWDYASNPRKLLEMAVDKFSNISDMAQPWLDMSIGGVKNITSGAVSFVKNKMDEMFSAGGGFDGDDSKESNGVYSYLMNIARGLMKKYGMAFTSGFRPGDPYDHGQGLAADIALPGVVNGSPIYQKAADEAIRMPGVKYVITNGRWKQKGQSWAPWRDGDHYDHVHISGEKPSGNNAGRGSSGVERWRETVVRALQLSGNYSDANVNRTLYQMKTESNGNPRAINNWDINAINGTPSKGLMQVIDPTFKSYAKTPFNKDIYDPLSNIMASVRYAVSRYGSLSSAFKGVGYENGGFITREHLAMVGEGNKPEMVIPLTKKSRAVDLINKAKQFIGMDDSTVVVASSNERLERLIEQQNGVIADLGDKMLALLSIIASKETNIDGKALYKNQSRHGGQDFKSIKYQGGLA